MKGETIRKAVVATGLALVVAAGGTAAGHGDRQHGDPRGTGAMGGAGMTRSQGMMGPGMMGGQGMMGPGPMGGMGVTGGMSPYAAGVLGLSAEQREQIAAIQRDRAREHWQLMQRMHQRGQAMMQLRRQPDPDPDALARAHERMSETHREMLRLGAGMRREIRGVLTEEQRNRLDEMRQLHAPQQ